jgi:hypothetical protein
MESRNRNIWIAVVVILVLACCCLAVAAAAAVSLGLADAFEGWRPPERLRDLSFDDFGDWDLEGSESAQIEETFAVGSSPTLEVDNFAGSVTIRAGEEREIHVAATKQALRSSALDRIEVEINERGGRLSIKTRKDHSLNSGHVQLEITVPADTTVILVSGAGDLNLAGLDGPVDASTGAGDVDIEDATGEIEVDTGAGDIRVRGSTNQVRLGTGVGDIDYDGDPSGSCRFNTGAGDIRLALPGSLSAEVDLESGMGTVEVGFDVDGHTSRRQVRGSIGWGEEASIHADTGLGDIRLVQR